MVKYSEFYLTSMDGQTEIHVNEWMPEDTELRGIVQIAHGVAEYGKRYEDFAVFLAENGFLVVAGDHLGHGKSLIKDSPMIYFGEDEGWCNAVDDVESIRVKIHMEHPELPYYMFGHSMGSFITRSHLIRHGGMLDGAIICGTGFLAKPLVIGGKIVAFLESRRIGKKGYSALVDKLAFGSYNKSYGKKRTEFDWLSVNEENVDKYIEDPLCGGKITTGLFLDLLEGISYVNNPKNIESMNKAQPLFLISGDQDPVGDMGKGVMKTYKAFKHAGIKDVEMKLYEGLRHEILNEKEHETVYMDVLNWLNSHLEG